MEKKLRKQKNKEWGKGKKENERINSLMNN